LHKLLGLPIHINSMEVVIMLVSCHVTNIDWGKFGDFFFFKMRFPSKFASKRLKMFFSDSLDLKMVFLYFWVTNDKLKF
jgi:hypothetical protein